MKPEEYKLMQKMAKAVEELQHDRDAIVSNICEIKDRMNNPVPVQVVPLKKMDVHMETTGDTMLDTLKYSQYELEQSKLFSKYGITSCKISF